MQRVVYLALFSSNEVFDLLESWREAFVAELVAHLPSGPAVRKEVSDEALDLVGERTLFVVLMLALRLGDFVTVVLLGHLELELASNVETSLVATVVVGHDRLLLVLGYLVPKNTFSGGTTCMQT